MLISAIRHAASSGHILASTGDNLCSWLEAGFLPAWAIQSIEELVAEKDWAELDNRFYKEIAFGTGGMRDRTIAQRPTKAELGTVSKEGSPEHAAVGCALLNDFNIIRATVGLYRYCAHYLQTTKGYAEAPRIVIAHDVRHFSKHFTELAASTWTRLGGQAYIFSGPRSTPHLSFSVRELGCTAGVVITASHNPPTDNGFKAYFSDGAQVVSPHAEAVIKEVYAVALADLSTYLEKDMSRVVCLPESFDEIYFKALEENVLDKSAIATAKPKVVFTPIHGVGGVASVPMLKRLGVEVVAVDEQWKFDPRFPTVKSPNPENAEALSMAIAKAKETNAEIVIATDPDADRMGVAVRDNKGDLVLLTGNQIGALLADFRISRLKELGRLPKAGTKSAALVKTFVTSPLQDAIGQAHGLKVINTLTGFKFIGDKMQEWETLLREKLYQESGTALDYDRTAASQREKLLLQHSTWYVFGGEESYGYLASDRVRDKDANAAVIMFCEMAAYLKAQGKTFIDALDHLYLQHGFHQESVINIYYEGASGAAKIKRILETYRSSPPKNIGEYAVTQFDDFGTQDRDDADGKRIPKQDLYIVHLDNGYSYAVRGSGTEPKIKFYLFAKEDVPEPSALSSIKKLCDNTLTTIKAAIDADARARAEG